ncbi:MAG: flagellar biosynthetic protein FliQ [Pseudomonadota bacterium]
MTAVAVVAGIPLLLATVIGLVISFLQAITQIQDQTLAQTAKMVAIALTFLAIGGALVGPLYEGTISVFTEFWTYR